MALKMSALSVLLLTIFGASTATAQIEDAPAVAIVDFSVTPANDQFDLGVRAADAIRIEFSKDNNVEILPGETVARAIDDLGLGTPPYGIAQLSRIGQDLQATNVVTGEVVDWQFEESGGNRRAHVALKVEMRDVASGFVINGASLVSSSPFRDGSVSDEALLQSALDQAAFQAYQTMADRSLPSATVLNTLEGEVLINKGSRGGMEKGMRVVVVRGSTQVAEGRVNKTDPTHSYVNITRELKGVQPGDKVRALYTVGTPRIGSGGRNTSGRTSRGGGGNNSGLVTLVIVLVLLAFLVGNGAASNQDLVASVRAEPMISPFTDNAAVRVSWVRDKFLRGNVEGPVQWQIFRNDDLTNPTAVADGAESSVLDDTIGSNRNGIVDTSGLPVAGEVECVAEAATGGTGSTTTIVPGSVYHYSASVVFRVNRNSLPDGGSSTGGGTTTTGGNTTGGNTTGGGGEEFCYFISPKTSSPGTATPFNRSNLRSPDNDQVVTTPIRFQFSSVRGPNASIQIQYVVQFSSSPTFPKGDRTVTQDPFLMLDDTPGSIVATPDAIDTSLFLQTDDVVYWRVGVQNPADVPGPAKDASGNRFIWSAARRFTRTIIPPK